MRTKKAARSVISELSEQKQVCALLNVSGVVYTHVPNGGARPSRKGGGRGHGQAEGVIAGCPDLLIFARPHQALGWMLKAQLDCSGFQQPIFADAHTRPCGLALELKRRNETWKSVTPEQKKFLAHLLSLGWSVGVGYGAHDAITKMLGCGLVLRVNDPIPYRGYTSVAKWFNAPRLTVPCIYCSGVNAIELREDVNGCINCFRSWGTK